MFRKHILFITMFSMLVISCATSSNISKPTQLNPDQPIAFIHHSLASELSEARLLELVNTVINLQKPQAVNYLKEQLFLRAQFAYFDGDYLKAQILYKHALNLDSNDVYLQTRYAITFVRLGKLGEAEAILERIFATAPSEKTGLLLAGIRVSLNKMDAAQKIYKKILASSPKSSDACLFLGKSYNRKKQWSRALARFKICSKRNPKNAKFHYEMAKISIYQKKIGLAKKSLRKALSLDSSFSQALLTLGAIYEDEKQTTRAYKLYSGHIEKHPEDYLVINKLVTWHFDADEGDKAIPFVEKLVDLEGSNTNLKVRLGILYVENQELDKAINIFEELLESAPKSEKVHYYLAAVYQEIENYEQAVHHYSLVPDSSTLFDDSILQIATILSFMANESIDQEELFAAHIQKHYKRSSIGVELGIIHASFFEKKKKYNEAISILANLKSSPKFQESHLFYMISLLEKDKQFVKVDAELKSYIEKNPKSAQALNFLGYSYLERGKDDSQAYKYISMALKISPNDGYIRDSMGWYYYKKGQFQKALGYLEKAYNDSAQDTEIAIHLAKALQATGQLNKALVLFRQALQKNKTGEIRKQIAESIEKVIRLKNATRLPASTVK